jgi:hypothetical protein
MANHAAPAAASTSGSRRLKFLPAFWVVSGETRETKAGGVPARSLSKELSAMLHVQRAGGPEENFELSAAGELELAEAAVRGVRQAMNNVKARGQANTALWQSELHRKRALERVDGPPLGNIPAGATDRRAAIDQSMRTRAESTRASFEIALAQNPNDLEAKFWVGYGNLFSTNMTEAGRGRKLLEEVAAGSQPDLAERARRTLNAAERYFPRKRPD